MVTMYGNALGEKNNIDMDGDQSTSPHGITSGQCNATTPPLVRNGEDLQSPKESDGELSAATGIDN